MASEQNYLKYLFPKMLKKIRQNRKIGIKEISEALHITVKDFEELENGNRFPTIYGLNNFSQIFGVPSSYLLTGESMVNSLSLLPLNANSPFVLWYYMWIDKKSSEITFTQIATYCSSSQYVLAAMGEKRLCDITFNDIDIYLKSKSFLSKRTIRDHKTLIKQVYNLAEACRKYNYNPAKNVKLPKSASKSKTTKIISQETRTMIMQFEHEMQLPAVIMLLAGLRRGEVLALTFDDINLEKGYISVNKVIEMRNGVPNLRFRAKSDAGVRKIDMPEILIAFIKAYIKKHPEKRKEDYIISNKAGKILAAKDFSRKWNNYIRNMNKKYSELRICKMNTFNSEKELPLKIERFTSKQLRHTYATMLYLSGTDILVTKELLGHSKVSTTLDFYCHLDNIYKKRNISCFNNFLINENF